MIDIKLEDNGAVQVGEAEVEPIKVFLAGPIQHWWQKNPDGTRTWDTELRKTYMEWRDAVRIAIVATGFCSVYSPHRAIQGAWHPTLQSINNFAIYMSDVLIDLTPPNVPIWGTAKEIELAESAGLTIRHVPPGTDADIVELIEWLREFNDTTGTFTSIRV